MQLFDSQKTYINIPKKIYDQPNRFYSFSGIMIPTIYDSQESWIPGMKKLIPYQMPPYGYNPQAELSNTYRLLISK